MINQQHLDEETLSAYFDGELAPAAAARARAHLATCERCEARLALLVELAAELDELPELRLERNLAPAVLDAIRDRATETAQTRGSAAHDRDLAAPVRERVPARGSAAARPRRPARALPLLFAAQLIAALLLLGLAWPPASSELRPAPAEQLAQQALLALETMWSHAQLPAELLRMAEAPGEILSGGSPGLEMELGALDALPLPTLEVASLALLFCTLLWVAGSAFLLRPIVRREASSLARRSPHE